MLSQKLQDDLMSAYHKVYEEKKGHAAGSDDTEKQASQLASDVRYKAKGKVPDGASKEEKMKIFLQILGASPAPNVVKAMAKQKLLGEGKVEDYRKAGNLSREAIKVGSNTKKGQEIMKKVNKMTKKMNEGMGGDIIKKSTNIIKKGKERLGKFVPKKGSKLDQQVNPSKEKPIFGEGTSYGITKGSGKPSGAMAGFGKAPRTQKGAMSYDGPNKERSEAADRVIAKTKAKRKKMKEGVKYDQNMPYVAGQTNKRREEKPMTPEQRRMIPEKMDAVGQEDGDINNDGKKDGTDKYLASRRKAIGKAIAKKRGKVKEGFSAWRIDLDFNESVKK